jgi:hypothetical protein
LMLPVHGRAISSAEIEDGVGRGFKDPRKFPALCNSLAWAYAKGALASLPSFTERVNVADLGIDAEWETQLPADHDSPLLGPGWNVFQYKQHDVSAQGRGRAFSQLKGGLKGAVEELHKRTGRRPERYVLFTNLDLGHFTGGQKGELRERILEGYDHPHDVRIEVVGAAELASFLNGVPYLRSAFFRAPNFCTVEEEWLKHPAEKPSGASVGLVGRGSEVGELNSWLSDPEIRAVVISGPRDMGKTRLALEVSKDSRPLDTVVALDPESLSIKDLMALESPGVEVVVVVEDPDPDKARRMLNQALISTGLKLLITLPTTENAPTPGFGQDVRVRYFRLGPLPDEQAAELLEAAGAGFDFAVESWVVRQASGNPGVLLLAASRGAELRETAAPFVRTVAEGFERDVRGRMGEDAIAVLRLLSLLTRVGVRGEAARELEEITALFGDGFGVNTVLNAIPRLDQAGLLRTRGSYVEVVPALLADGLASAALSGRGKELGSLFAALEQSGRMRLLQRLQALRTEEVDEVARFWDGLFAPSGPLESFQSAVSNPDLLRLVASAVPDRFVAMAEGGLVGMNLDERSEIRNYERRELVWALQETLYRRNTGVIALRCLALLAEAETESYGNNATETFTECFNPLHPQFPVPLRRRLGMLKGLFAEENAKGLRLLAIRAATSGLSRKGFFLHPGSGAEPLDSGPSLTYGEIWDYAESLVDLLVEASRSEDSEVAGSAGKALPGAIADLIFQGRPEVAIGKFEEAVDQVLAGDTPVPVSDLADKLGWTGDVLAEHVEGPDPGRDAQLRRFVRQVNEMTDRLRAGDFSIRLKRWAGGWTRDDYEDVVGGAGQSIPRHDKELGALAREAIETPEVLSDELLSWLRSPEAEKVHVFFHLLGKYDFGKKWLPRVEQMGAAADGVLPFAYYIFGLGQHDHYFASKRLDELTGARAVTAEAIARATGLLGVDSAGVDRLETLVGEGRIEPYVVGRLLHGRWADPLDQDGYLRLLKALVGTDPENAMVVVELSSMWAYLKKPVEGKLADFIWRCLEAARPTGPNDTYRCDRLASEMAANDPERGFRLAEALLGRPYGEVGWKPISSYGETRLWETLREADRERCLRLVFTLAMKDPPVMDIYQILWKGVDEEQDHEALFNYACESERQAEIVSEIITTAYAGFWRLAFELLERYPNNETIESNLVGGLLSREGRFRMWGGPLAARYAAAREEVERRIADADTPSSSLPWLEETRSVLLQRERERRVREDNWEAGLP